jgi:hypothetical protein
MLALGLILALTLWGFVDIDHPFYPLAIAIPAFALLRLPGHPQQGPVGRYLIGLLGVTSLTHAVFFGDDRYHLVVTPVLCILAAAGLRSPEASG